MNDIVQIYIKNYNAKKEGCHKLDKFYMSCLKK